MEFGLLVSIVPRLEAEVLDLEGGAREGGLHPGVVNYQFEGVSESEEESGEESTGERERKELMIVWLLGYGAPWPTVVRLFSPCQYDEAHDIGGDRYHCQLP